MNLIKSHYINRSKYGVISLIVNVTSKSIGGYHYSDSNDNEFIFEDYETGDEELLEVDMKLIPTETYVRCDMQEKDQITFFWIPLILVV